MHQRSGASNPIGTIEATLSSPLPLCAADPSYPDCATSLCNNGSIAHASCRIESILVAIQPLTHTPPIYTRWLAYLTPERDAEQRGIRKPALLRYFRQRQ